MAEEEVVGERSGNGQSAIQVCSFLSENNLFLNRLPKPFYLKSNPKCSHCTPVVEHASLCLDGGKSFHGFAEALLRYSCICCGSVRLFLFFRDSWDIVHDDDDAPKKPGCENDFVLVKVQTWVDGVEDAEFVGVGARFGPKIVSKEKNAHQSHLTLSDPPDCCTAPRKQLARDVIMVHRGNCRFTTKANVAEAAGASAVLIINNQKELYKMVCEPDETDLDIKIPAVMLPQEAVSVQLYSPRRPLVDIAEVFLWLMAVGTILCASYWSAWSAREAAIEQDKLLKDASDELTNAKDGGASGVVDINTTSAVLFVVIASCFLVMLYKLMSYWFVELLVVLFCIGLANLSGCFVVEAAAVDQCPSPIRLLINCQDLLPSSFPHEEIDP
ncbi:Signal peptide peptidase-like 2 [Vitis vinifera]|uniref:Signal peptide peptidase-like 2 n=1 Tax=Vitis vinifera TaxID=29760 RepID=A0A438BZF8_VITVI|nr:Signal peptide peptidase-like 2 [Vitis vinifera]